MPFLNILSVQLASGLVKDVNKANNLGATALHKACGRGCLETARVLVMHGADMQCLNQVIVFCASVSSVKYCEQQFQTPVDLIDNEPDKERLKVIIGWECLFFSQQGVSLQEVLAEFGAGLK